LFSLILGLGLFFFACYMLGVFLAIAYALLKLCGFLLWTACLTVLFSVRCFFALLKRNWRNFISSL
jgi:hypothetical protein